MFSLHLSVFRTIGVFRTFEYLPECNWEITIGLDLKRGRKGRTTTTTMESVKSAVTPPVTCSSVSHVIFGGRPLALSCGSMNFRLSLSSFSPLTPPDPLPPPTPQTLPLLPCPIPSFPQLSFELFLLCLLHFPHAPAPPPP